MTRLKLLLLGVLTMALTACSGGIQAYDLPLPGKQVDPDDGYQVVAKFADVVDVVPRTLVLMNDVPVGQVDEVRREGWHARVTMTVRKDIELPANAVADVRKTSLLGEKYIALLPPDDGSQASGRLEDKSVIPMSRTGRNPDVEEVLGSLSFLLARGGVGQLKTISTELNAMMTGRTDDMRSVLERLDRVTGTLDDSKSDIIDAMTELDRLAVTLNRERDAIDAALDSFGPAIEVLDEQHDDLVRLLRALDQLGKISTKVVKTSGDNLVEAMRLLRPVLTELSDAGDSLPRGLMMLASFPFPKESADLARGNYSNALFHLELDLNKAFQGVLTGGDTGLPQLFQICMTYSPDCKRIIPLAQALCQLTSLDLACSVAPAPAAAALKKATAKPAASGPAAVTGTGPVPNVLPSAVPKNPVDGLVGQLNRVLGNALGGSQ
ncbi:MAG TPA: MCE family protein [Aeromicrobium sp.]|nr:MCE family protein [Aeromicrobium sp.]